MLRAVSAVVFSRLTNNSRSSVLSGIPAVTVLVLCLMYLQKKPPPDLRVLKIRDYEDKLLSMQQRVQVTLLSTCFWAFLLDGSNLAVHKFSCEDQALAACSPRATC